MSLVSQSPLQNLVPRGWNSAAPTGPEFGSKLAEMRATASSVNFGLTQEALSSDRSVAAERAHPRSVGQQAGPSPVVRLVAFADSAIVPAAVYFAVHSSPLPRPGKAPAC